MPNPTPEERDRETARRIAATGHVYSPHARELVAREIESALSTARREGEAEAAVLREAAKKVVAGLDVDIGPTLEAAKELAVILSSTTAGASLLKRLEDA